MKVAELIEKLKECDQTLDVFMYYDGDARLMCDGAFFRPSHENWNSEDALYTRALVLCETSDVYRTEPDDVWQFKAKT